MITIVKSPNADSRSVNQDFSCEKLRTDTQSHIRDVSEGLNFMAELIKARGPIHDHTKLDMLEEFCAALSSGHIKDTEWYKKHITQERHHLLSYVHDDITLVDVIEHVVDCVMAGMARSGNVYDIELPNEVLQLAVKNTVELLKKNTHIVDSDNMLDSPIED